MEGRLEENSEVDSVFTNNIGSPECLQMLFNSFQNTEKKIKEIHETQDSNAILRAHKLKVNCNSIS